MFGLFKSGVVSLIGRTVQRTSRPRDARRLVRLRPMNPVLPVTSVFTGRPRRQRLDTPNGPAHAKHDPYYPKLVPDQFGAPVYRRPPLTGRPTLWTHVNQACQSLNNRDAASVLLRCFSPSQFA